MAIQLRADDVMPWGKWTGYTLRTIYKKDYSYYLYLLNHKKDYKIDEQTRYIIESGKLQKDKTEICASKASYFNRIEYKINDVIDWGMHKGKTLIEIFLKNETYYRFIVENEYYYISPTTFAEMKQRKARNIIC